MILYDAIRELIREVDLPKSIADERGGVYRFPMDETTEVEIRDVPPGFVLFCKFAENVDKKLEEWYIHVLSSGTFGKATSGAILGLTNDGKQLTLTFPFEYPFVYKEFRDHLEEFFNTIDYWKEERDLFQKGKLVV